MRQRIVVALMPVWFSLTALVPQAQAQRVPSATKEDLKALQSDLEALRGQTVQIPTLAASVQELSARLARLEQALRTREAEQKAIPDAIGRLDGLDKEVATLVREVAEVRGRLAALEQPWEPEPTTGGMVYKDGFAWSTPEGRYAIELGGYLQGRYELAVSDGDLDTSTLRLRRARFGASGHLGKLQYKLLLSAIKDRPALDYYMDYAFLDQLVLRVGQYKTQFTRSFITSSSRLAFVERPLAIEGIRYDRDIQVGVHGLLHGDRVGYYAGIGNGAGPNAGNDNRDIAATVRVDGVVLGRRFGYGYGDVGRTEVPSVMVGAGAMYDLVAMPGEVDGIAVNNNVDADEYNDNVRVIGASFDAIVRYRGFEAAVEAVYRYEDFGTILEHVDNGELVAAIGNPDSHSYLGVTGQITYLLPRNILIGGRLGRSRVPFLGVGGRSSHAPRGAHVLELDGLAQLYNDRGYRLVGLMYSMHDYSPLDAAADGSRDHRVIVETQLKF